jgi:hypothetical protein
MPPRPPIPPIGGAVPKPEAAKPIGAVMNPPAMPGIDPGAGIIAAGPYIPIPIPMPIPGNIKFMSMSKGRFISSSVFATSFFLISSVLF